MRTILFFDLPMNTKKEKCSYVHFLKSIKMAGFIMFQESVYTKLSLNQTIADQTISRIKKDIPDNGIISVLTLTENQFASITNLLGEVVTDVIADDRKVVEL